MLEGDGRVGIMPYVRGLTAATAVPATTEANPTPYPYPVPVAAARLTRAGWVVDGRALDGVAPITWTVGGYDVDAVGVVMDGARVVAVLGSPVLDGVALDGAHLVLADR